MYKVVKLFKDLQDNEYLYNVGDEFPRSGLSVTAERLAELAGSKNRQRQPLIVLMPDGDLTADETPEDETPEAAEEPQKKKAPARKSPAKKAAEKASQ